VHNRTTRVGTSPHAANAEDDDVTATFAEVAVSTRSELSASIMAYDDGCASISTSRSVGAARRSSSRGRLR
jgi:hypothetical protein